MSIFIKILGYPSITINKRDVSFPHKKVEALFYFLMLEKTSSRDKLAFLLWDNLGQMEGRKSVNRALYELRRIFGKETFLSRPKTIVEFSPPEDLSIDLDSLLGNEPLLYLINNNSLELLEDFYVDSSEYMTWLEFKREGIRKKILQISSSLEKRFIEEGNFDNAEKLARINLGIDSYDEEAILRLLHILTSKGQFTLAKKEFNIFEKRLFEELETTVSAKTKAVYEHIQEEYKYENLINKPVLSNSKKHFFGRNSELRQMAKTFLKSQSKKKMEFILINGKEGSGKTALAQEFLSRIKSSEVLIISSECYETEQELALGSFSNLLYQLKLVGTPPITEKLNSPVIADVIFSFFPSLGIPGDTITSEKGVKVYRTRYLYEVISSILQTASSDHGLIVFIDDIHWIDKESVSLIIEILNKNLDCPLLFLASARPLQSKQLSNLLAILRKKGILNEIFLEDFSEDETYEFCKFCYPDFKYNDEILTKIYSETEGNPFFLTEALNLLHSGGQIQDLISEIEDVLKNRIGLISKTSLKLLQIMSIFTENVDPQFVKQIHTYEDQLFSDLIEELQTANILKETITSQGALRYKFTHCKLREYVYSTMSETRRRLYHQQIGDLLEKANPDVNNETILLKIYNHYSKAKNNIKEIEYLLKMISGQVIFHMFPFPSIDDINIRSIDVNFLDLQQINNYLVRLENLFQGIYNNSHDMDHQTSMLSAFCRFKLLKGYLLLREERFNETKQLATECYELARNIGLNDFAVSSLELSGRTEMIRHNPQNAFSFFNSMYREAQSYNNLVKQGVALRLMGLQYLFSGEYDSSQNCLKESIALFEQLKQMGSPYSLCEAAAYDILGEVHLFQGDYDQASNFFRKAVLICNKVKIYKGQESFYSGLGHSLYNQGQIDKAKRSLEKSLQILYKFMGNQIKYRGWYRGIVVSNGIMSLIMARDMNYEECIQHFEKAIEFAERSQRIDLLGIIERIKAEMASLKGNDPYLETLLSDILPCDTSQYKAKAIKLLEKTGNIGDLEIVKNL